MANKTDVVVKLVLVLFVSLLSFAVGTYVGRKTSDNQHKMAILEPGGAANSHGGEGSAEASSTLHGNEQASEALTDAEIAKLAEEFVTDGHETTPDEQGSAKAEVAHGEVAHGELGHGEVPHAEASHTKEAPTGAVPAIKVAGAHEKPAPAPVAQKAPASHHQATGPSASKHLELPSKITHAPINPEEATRKPSSINKNVAQYSVGKFTVQVASFGNKNDAEKRSVELTSKGYNAFVIPAHIKGKTWYRVSVGLFATEKEAKGYKAEFVSKGNVEDALVQKISN